MNSTPTPKETDAQKAADTQVGRPDERLAHAYEEIKRADEQLTQMSERLAKIEGDTPRPAAAAPAPPVAACASRRAATCASITCASTPSASIASKAGVPEPHGVAAGGGLRCHGPGLVGLWRRDCHPVGAAARFNAIIAARRSNACRAVRAIHRSGGVCGDRTTAGNTKGDITGSNAAGNAIPANATAGNIAGPGPDRAARCRAARGRTACRPPPAAAAPPDQAQLLQKIARDLATLERNIEAAQGEPAANGHRQFKGHWRTQGQPGRNETVRSRRRPSRPRPRHPHRLPRGRLRSCAGPSGRISRRRRERGRDITRGRSGTTTIGSRRRGDRRNSFPVRTLGTIRSAAQHHPG